MPHIICNIAYDMRHMNFELELQSHYKLHNARITRIADRTEAVLVPQSAIRIERQIGGRGIGQTGEVDRAVNPTELGVVENIEGVSA